VVLGKDLRDKTLFSKRKVEEEEVGSMRKRVDVFEVRLINVGSASI